MNTGAPLRVLVAEDESLIVLAVADSLERAGHVVCGHAQHAEEAVALARRLRPDICLVDIRLAGGSDGLRAAAELSRLGFPVVLASAHASAALAASVGARGWLLKPYTPGELVATVLSAAAGGRAAEESSPS